MSGRWEYLLGGGGATIHVSDACPSARRCSHLRPVSSTHAPDLVWDLLWHNHHRASPRGDQSFPSPFGDEALPPLGDDALAADGEPVDQVGYGVTRWGCLHCLQPAALDRGWTNSWPPDPQRRHA